MTPLPGKGLKPLVFLLPAYGAGARGWVEFPTAGILRGVYPERSRRDQNDRKSLRVVIRITMNPITHFLVGWAVANSDPRLERRDRALISVAGVIPDVDALGIAAETLTKNWDRPLLWWTDYHHVLGHNLPFAVVVLGICVVLARRRWVTGALALLAFHLHLVGDIVGSGGPEGELWSISYLWPLSQAGDLLWEGQWAVNAWPNFVVTGVVLSWTFYLAWKRGYSPLEMVSASADTSFVDTLRQRFRHPDGQDSG